MKSEDIYKISGWRLRLPGVLQLVSIIGICFSLFYGIWFDGWFALKLGSTFLVVMIICAVWYKMVKDAIVEEITKEIIDIKQDLKSKNESPFMKRIREAQEALNNQKIK